MFDVDNNDRATWAYEGAKAFGKIVNQYEFPDEYAGMDKDTIACLDETIGDLMGDLLHLADRLGLDPAALLERAESYFNDEKNDEYCVPCEENGESEQ